MTDREIHQQLVKIAQHISYLNGTINDGDLTPRMKAFRLRRDIRQLTEIAKSFDGVIPEDLKLLND